jgi:tetratricopeptide (TPR) repeat protein
MLLRSSALALFALLALSGQARASLHDQKRIPIEIDGEYDSPLGRVRIRGQGTSYKASLASPSSLCPFKAGEEVLRATLLDDSLAGQMRVCLSGSSCSGGEEWASVVLLASGKQLSGAVHVSGKGCAGPFGDKGGVTFSRAQGRPAQQKPVSASAKKNRLARVRSILQDGKAYLDEGDFEAARKRFQQAIGIDASVPEAYNGVGVTYRMRNALSDALAWYKKALLVDPDFGDAYYNMACVYALQGKREMALRYLKIAALNGYVTGDGIDADSDLESLRNDPEYRELRTKM